jgi:pheromone shutdown protein TraB
MIIILGTSHVSKQSSREVKEAIQQADVVCLELDVSRAHGLLQNKQASFSELRKALGLKAAVMAVVLRAAQQRIAKNLNVLPGLEMRAALKECMEQHKTVALIDRDIRVTMQRLSKAFGWRELWQLIKDFKPRRVPVHPSDDLVLELLAELKQRYPRVYKVMVSERDHHMAAALIKVQHDNKDKIILAIMGKGHITGVQKQINYLNRYLPISLWISPRKNYRQS